MRQARWWAGLAGGLLAMAAQAGDLLVSSRFSDNVLRYDATTGAYVGVFAQGNGLDNPNGIAYGPDGHLYVGLGDVGRVMVFDGRDGTYLRDFVTPADSGGLAGARAIAFLADGDLLVADGAGDRILRYAAGSGSFRGVFAQGNSLDGPVGLIVAADGEVYVGAALSNKVLVFGPDGAFRRVREGDPGQRNATGLVFDRHGQLLVAQSVSNTVQRMDPLAGAATTFASDGGLQIPIGMIFHPGGDLLVGSFGDDRVLRYSGSDGRFLGDFVSAGAGGLDGTHNLVFMPDAIPAASPLAHTLASGSRVDSLVDIGDLDGDRKRDLIVGLGTARQVEAWSGARGVRLWQSAPGPAGYAHALAAAGDVNQDGYADVIVGAAAAPGGGLAQLLSGADGAVLRTLPAPAQAQRYGHAVAGIEDLDGDGARELIVGDPGAALVRLHAGDDGSVLRSHAGAGGSEYGSALAWLPDLDGDHVDDYAIGAPREGSGRVHVHSGASGAALFVLDGAGGGFGETHLAPAGDVDGDGVGDIYTGAPDENAGAGTGYLHSGRDGHLLRSFACAPGEALGPGLGAGDFDGDGHGDVLIGMPGYGSGGLARGGRVSLRSGRDGRVLTQVDGSRRGGETGSRLAALGEVNGDGRLDFALASALAAVVESHAGGVSRPLFPAAEASYSGIYWNAAEPGWGFNVSQQGDFVFGTWYTYASDGAPMFLTVQATRQQGRRFAGPIYRISGIPHPQIDGAQAFTDVREVGSAELGWDLAGQLNLDYTVEGVSQQRALTPIRFDPRAPRCFASTLTRERLDNVSDLWWNPREPGWGLTLTQQGDTLVAAWYTFGAGGRDQWLIASSLARQPDGSYAGALTRALSGTPLAAIAGPATSFPVPEAGSARLRFSDGEHGIFEYSVDGVTRRKAIARLAALPASAPVAHCFDTPADLPETEVRTEFIATSLSENGQPVQLEMVIHKPAGPGPFPTVMFNHGSTGSGNDPSLFTRTWTHQAAAGWFNARGWMVVFPQRRGRGRSGGTYAEGLAANGSGYSCNTTIALAGMERALSDIDEVLVHLRTRPDVDAQRMLIAGQSRGGILAIVHAGTRPGNFVGALNFVGGWMSDGCSTVAAINTASFRRGAAFAGRSAWLYGENDPFYSIAHSEANFQAFRNAGGRGEFHRYALGSGISGHNVINYPERWSAAVEALIDAH